MTSFLGSSFGSVTLVRDGGSLGLFARRAFAVGERILRIDGVIVCAPSRLSIQVGIDRHVEYRGDASAAVDAEAGLWRFLNHSCTANAALGGRDLADLRAVRAIAAGDEVTFDYLTTEFELAAPFACRCGAADCVGEVRGFRHLTARQRAQRTASTAPHVLELARRHELP